MPGTTLGPYRLEAEVGSGAMGTVYAATVTDRDGPVPPGTRVAVKVVHPHLISRPTFLKRFHRELLAGRRVDHPNVVRTYDGDLYFRGDTPLCLIIMEYVEGRRLRDLIADLGALPEALVREIGRQVAAGLAAIHDAGIVHRDLKPENVLITGEHEVRIMDLGVARLAEESVVLTQEGRFVGSVCYAAPEQFRRGRVGPAADLYSCGVLLYELAAGANPFASRDSAAIMSAHLELVPERLRIRNPAVSDFLSEVVSTLLEKDPAKRFPTASGLLEALEQGESSAWWAARSTARPRTGVSRVRIPVRRRTSVLGREAELETLRRAWDRANAGDGNAVLVEGEAGIGKTRLVDRFLDAIDGDGTSILYGSYSPTGGLGALADALLGRFGHRGLEDALRPYMGATPRLVPAFAAALRRESPPEGELPVSGDVLHAAFVQVMRALAAEEPLLWIVDDLHFAEPEGREVVLSLARAVAGHRVLLLVTTRPGLRGDVRVPPGGLPDHTFLPLGRLGARHVIELLSEAFRSPGLAEKLGGRIALKSDGVPFFVFEMIRGLEEGQFIEKLPDGTYVETRVVEEIEVPSAVRDLVEARLRDLSREERAVLDVAAVQGYEFEAGPIARVRGTSRLQVLESLAAVERRSGVVQAVERRFRFDHHQIMEVVYGALPPELKEEYHGRLGDALAETAGITDLAAVGVPGETAEALASHYLSANRPLDALPYLLPALRHLADTDRHEAGVKLADRALAERDLLTGRLRAELLLGKSQRLETLGRHPEQREAAEEALDLAESLGEKGLVAHALLDIGRSFLALSDHARAWRRFDRALRVARDAGDRRKQARADASLGAVCSRRGEFEEALGHFERQLAISLEEGDRLGEAQARGNLGAISYDLGRYAEALEHHRRSLAIAREIGNRGAENAVNQNLAFVFRAQGQYEEARVRLEECVADARERGDRPGVASATGALGLVLEDLGLLEAALAKFELLAAIARETGSLPDEAFAHADRAAACMRLGDLDAARREIDEGLGIVEPIGARRLAGYLRFEKGELTRLEGRPDAALEEYEAALDLLREVGDRAAMSWALAATGRMLAACGEEARAHDRLVEAFDLAREIGKPDSIVFSACLLALLRDGHTARAVELFGEYGDRTGHAERMEARFLLWRATKDVAHLAAAHRLLEHLVDHSPASFRETTLTGVPLHRDIVAAWKEHGGEAA